MDLGKRPPADALYAWIEDARPAEVAPHLVEFASGRGAEGDLEPLAVASAAAELWPRVPGELARPLAASVLRHAARHPERWLEEKWLRQLPRENRPFVFTGSLSEVLAEPSLEKAALRFSLVLQATGRESAFQLLLEAAAWAQTPRVLAVATSLARLGNELEIAEWRGILLRLLEALRGRTPELPLRGPRSVGAPIDYRDLVGRALRDGMPGPAIAWLRAAEAETIAGPLAASVQAGIRRWIAPRPAPSADSRDRDESLAREPGFPTRERESRGQRPLSPEWRTLLETTLPLLEAGDAEPFLTFQGLCLVAARLPELEETALRNARERSRR